MKVTGSATLHAPRAAVWQALQDPAVLVRTIPGCSQLRATGDDVYEMTVTAGVASIKGTYLGTVRLADRQPPEAYTLVATGQGAPGTVQAEARVRLAELEDGGTRLDYDADAIVGGMIGGVGQRVLAGVAKRTAGEFFAAVDRHLTGVPEPREEVSEPAAIPEAGVFRAPAPVAATLPGNDFMRGAVFGAAVALAGVVVGWLVGRRR